MRYTAKAISTAASVAALLGSLALSIPATSNADAAMIEAGKQIDSMPMLFESIELSATPQDVAAVEAESQPAAAINTTDTSPVALEKLRPRNFFGRIWFWLKSPINVKWRDTK